MAKAATKPAPVEVEETIYDELIAAIQAAGPAFKEQAVKETEQQFYIRALEAIGNLDEEAWSAISDEAQGWYNKGIKAANQNKAVVTCPGFEPRAAKAAPVKAAAAPVKRRAAPVEEEEEAVDEEVPEEEAAEEEEEAPPTRRAAKPAAKAAPVKASSIPVKRRAAPVEEEVAEEEEAPAPKKKAAFGGKQAAPFQPKGPKLSVTCQIRLLLVKDIDTTVEKIRAVLSKKGFDDVKTSATSALRGDITATIKAAVAAGKWVEG